MRKFAHPNGVKNSPSESSTTSSFPSISTKRFPLRIADMVKAPGNERNTDRAQYSFLYFPNDRDKELATKGRFSEIRIVEQKKFYFNYSCRVEDCNSDGDVTLSLNLQKNNQDSHDLELKIPTTYRKGVSHSLVALYGGIMNHVGMPNIDGSYKAYVMANASDENKEEFKKFVSEFLMGECRNFIPSVIDEYNKNIAIKELCDEKIKADFDEMKNFMKL